METKQVEQLISIVSSLKADLGSLTNCFHNLLTTINDEHDALKCSRLDSLETITASKEAIGEAIITHGEAILRNSERIKSYYQEVAQDSGKDAYTTRDVKVWLEAICNQLDPHALSTKVLTKLVDSVGAAFEELNNLKKKSQIKIEMNTYLVRKLLDHHHETIKLWQEVAQQSEATYSNKGESRSQQAKSVLQVKA